MCTGHTHCIDAADTNDDLVIAAPGDGGQCAAAATPTPTGPRPTATPTLPGPPPPTPTTTPSPTPATCPCFYAGELSAGLCAPPLALECAAGGSVPTTCPGPVGNIAGMFMLCWDPNAQDGIYIADIETICRGTGEPPHFYCLGPGSGPAYTEVTPEQYAACGAAILASGSWGQCSVPWSNGTLCYATANFCSSGYCVDGVCCDLPLCAPGYTCNGSVPGYCGP